ncbi:MAG: triose-phosphate isomerase [Planctomycetota bacterium]
MRRSFVAGNWKMNLDRGLAKSLVAGLRDALEALAGQGDVGLFPPFTLLSDVARAAEGSGMIVGAQNCHHEKGGAYTGEVSAAMVKDAGGTHVILGHSERRQYYGEDEELLAKKLRAALAQGLHPILCVGEQLSERDQGRTLDVVRNQVQGALAGFSAADLSTLTLAYEPVWAIGTGRTATPDQAVEVHAALRGLITELFDGGFASRLRIQYGGSVNADNATTLMGEVEIDGALVGGASLKLDSFLAICKAARAH